MRLHLTWAAIGLIAKDKPMTPNEQTKQLFDVMLHIKNNYEQYRQSTMPMNNHRLISLAKEATEAKLWIKRCEGMMADSDCPTAAYLLLLHYNEVYKKQSMALDRLIIKITTSPIYAKARAEMEKQNAN